MATSLTNAEVAKIDRLLKFWQKAREAYRLAGRTFASAPGPVTERKYDETKAAEEAAQKAYILYRDAAHARTNDVQPVALDDKPNMGELMKSEDDIGQQTEGALSVLRQTVKDNPHKLSNAHLDVLRARIVKLESKLAKLRARDASPFDRDTDKGAAAVVKREKAAGMLAHDIAKKYGFSLSFVNETLGSKKANDVKPV